MTTPYAKLLVSQNGGSPASGGLTLAASANVQLSFESTIGWEKYRIDVVGPPDWAGPPGWANESGMFVYTGVDTPPPAFAMPSATGWGKFMFALTVNDGRRNGAFDAAMVDRATGLSLHSANDVEDVGLFETVQFSPLRGWLGSFQRALRKLETALANGGGSGSSGIEVTDPAGVTCTAGAGNVDTLVYTVPASPTGPGRFVHTGLLLRLSTALTGTGSVVVTAGTTAGGNDLQTAITVTSTTPVGTVIGLDSSKLGSLCTSADDYNAKLAAGTTIYVRLAESGTVTSHPVLVAHEYGLHL